MARITLVALLALAACSGAGDAAVAPTSTTSAPPTTTVAGVPPDGYRAVQAAVTAADGEVCELCVWLAETADQRSRGLMYATTLQPAQAMAFVYPRPTTSSFWMRNTSLPLSIAFYDAAGAFMDSFDMAPCTSVACPSYPTPRQFSVAVETYAGDLPQLLMVPGSTLELTDLPCDPGE